MGDMLSGAGGGEGVADLAYTGAELPQDVAAAEGGGMGGGFNFSNAANKMSEIGDDANKRAAASGDKPISVPGLMTHGGNLKQTVDRLATLADILPRKTISTNPNVNVG